MKKKVLAVALVVILAVTAVAGASLAYLTDTQTQINTFTSGNVDIKLEEYKVRLGDDGYIAETLTEWTSDDQNFGKMYPGQVITKNPTITNIGSEKAYVAAKITVTATDLESLIGTGYEGLLGINRMVSGGLVKENDTMKPDHPLHGVLPVYGDDTYSIFQVKESEGVHVFYIFMEAPMAPNASVTLFDTITIPAQWGNEEMAKITDLQIQVEAFAVQTQTFDTCLEAMKTAFADQFQFN